VAAPGVGLSEEIVFAVCGPGGWVIENLQELQVKAEKVVAFLSDPALVKQLRADKSYNLHFLRESHGVGPEDIDALFHYAKFQFECGNYSAAAEFLYHYRSLCTNSERGSSALWGKFAADILQQDWDTAVEARPPTAQCTSTHLPHPPPAPHHSSRACPIVP